MDGVALQFVKNAVIQTNSKALFAAGCFWCLEAVFENIKGVKSVVSGYAGGTRKTLPMSKWVLELPVMPRQLKSFTILRR